MDEPIFFMARECKAQGHRQGSLPNIEKVKSFIYEQDYAIFESFTPTSVPKLTVPNPTLLYPGSGCDILMPLLYVEKLFPTTPEFTFVFVDLEAFLPLIKTVLDDVEIPFSSSKEGVIFYWRNLKVNLRYYRRDVFSSLSDIGSFDVYFEKAFRIIKEESTNHLEYDQTIIDRLNSGGVIISDSGFLNHDLTYYDVPKELSSYGEMVLAQKR